jgi:hypothetical protein
VQNLYNLQLTLSEVCFFKTEPVKKFIKWNEIGKMLWRGYCLPSKQSRNVNLLSRLNYQTIRPTVYSYQDRRRMSLSQLSHTPTLLSVEFDFSVNERFPGAKLGQVPWLDTHHLKIVIVYPQNIFSTCDYSYLTKDHYMVLKVNLKSFVSLCIQYV